MDNAFEMLRHPFTLGLILGLIFFGLACVAHFKTKMEFRRYRKLLSDKMEIESAQIVALRSEKEKLARENENLRIKAAQTSELPQHKLERQLEILARAERQMVINAPGFAPAWENAKSQAHGELVEEDRGNTLPKRIFKKFFGPGKEATVETIEETASARSSDHRHT